MISLQTIRFLLVLGVATLCLYILYTYTLAYMYILWYKLLYIKLCHYVGWLYQTCDTLHIYITLLCNIFFSFAQGIFYGINYCIKICHYVEWLYQNHDTPHIYISLLCNVFLPFAQGRVVGYTFWPYVAVLANRLFFSLGSIDNLHNL